MKTLRLTRSDVFLIRVALFSRQEKGFSVKDLRKIDKLATIFNLDDYSQYEETTINELISKLEDFKDVMSFTIEDADYEFLITTWDNTKFGVATLHKFVALADDRLKNVTTEAKR